MSRPRQRSLRAEALESRRMLAAAILEHAGTAYVVSDTEPTVYRYDINAETWNAEIALEATTALPTTAHVDAEGIYVAFDKSVYRYDLDGTNRTHLINAANTVQALHTDGNLLFINHSSGLYTNAISINKDTNTVIDTAEVYVDSIYGSSIAKSHNRLIGRSLGISPADITYLGYDDNGDFTGGGDSPYHGDYAGATQTWVFPDDAKVVDDSGNIYAADSLTHVGSFGSNIDDITFWQDTVPVIVDGATVTAFTNSYLPTGSTTLAYTPESIFSNQDNIITFAANPLAANEYDAQVVAISDLNPPEPGPVVDPVGLAYVPDDLFLADDGSVLIFSQNNQSIFRWDPLTETYVESIPLIGVPNFAAYSAVNDTIYLAYNNGLIRQIDMSDPSREEVPLVNLSGQPLGLATAGSFIFAVDPSGAWVSHYTYTADGTQVSAEEWNYRSNDYVWSDVNQKMYFLRDDTSPNDLLWEDIDADGTGAIGGQQDTPLHGSAPFSHPLRVSPDGSIVVLGTGAIFDAITLERSIYSLANTIHDATWIDGQLVTMRNTAGVSQLQRWTSTTYGEDLVRQSPREGLALMAVREDRLLSITEDASGVPVFEIFDSNLDPSYVPIMVDSFGDGGDADLTDGIAADANGNVTLRAAIEQANYSANGDEPQRIDLAFAGPGPHVIDVQTPLPPITESVVIDGTMAEGYAVGAPVVHLQGNGTVADGLVIQSPGTEVRGLSITGFSDAGIEVAGGGGTIIEDNFLGITPDGNADGNYFGAKVVVSPDNTLRNNVIGGNTRSGIFVTGVASTNNVISENTIGSDVTGMTPMPNGTDGITLFAPGNIVENNLLSGNERWGVLIRQAHATGNVIRNNDIGVDAAGTAALANRTGITVQSGDNQIYENIVSGNSFFGISLTTSQATGNDVWGNMVGTNADGTTAIGNEIVGVRATNASGNTIGGTGTGQANVISGNAGFGVLLALDGTTNNVVLGNKIGTDPSGNVAVGNGSNGVRISIGASQNTIRENQISGNGGSGIGTGNANTINNDILFNLIGTNAAADSAIHNASGGAVRLTSPQTRVEGNTISSPDTGILAFGNASDLQIVDNFIGTNAAEEATLGMQTGIRLTTGAVDAWIAGNVIAHHETGISVEGSATRAHIEGNSIYGNSTIGIDLGGDGATANDAGDADTGQNQMQNSPVISQAVLVGDQLTITYIVESLAENSDFDLQIEFFLSDGAAQGQRSLGTDSYQLASAGNSQTVVLTVTDLSVTDKLTATATDAQGNTSEFSLDVEIM